MEVRPHGRCRGTEIQSQTYQERNKTGQGHQEQESRAHSGPDVYDSGKVGNILKLSQGTRQRLDPKGKD